ncbi:Phd_YefM [Aequorivita sublithincola DSM 14238]|uniref:Phd_YefM n=1 Tax=Aequorivita sublithincola (strain DSM 14238 / LMG 21431 / ACAM 643 / 9-3) TaxID=746697 RepID=I3YTH5_AEQSU|nr:hypothetical protein [Aequorivita sublithincola]AFL80293.1 Phd_YefM [Aequorivita sublithincola DSM 14238]
METQYVTDKKGKKVAVILSIEEYQKMLEELEAVDDIKLYDEAKKNQEESIVAEEAFKSIEKNR